MQDWSQDSAHPFGDASSDERVSDHDSVTESRWSEVYRLLPAPGGESFALAGTATANKARRERSGTPIELTAPLSRRRRLTYRGAARLVAASLGVLPRTIAVTRLDVIGETR